MLQDTPTVKYLDYHLGNRRKAGFAPLTGNRDQQGLKTNHGGALAGKISADAYMQTLYWGAFRNTQITNR
jgi:hypothetical protein